MDFDLNGVTRSVTIEPGTSLLELLRDQLGLRSMKDGCAPEGSCGACTVIVDGRAVVSCAQPAERVAGRQVETLEGLDADVRDLWADAFTATGASQCGYCTPGIVMKAEALLRKEAHARRARPSRRRWPATSAAARATSPSWTPSSRSRLPARAVRGRCWRPATASVLARPSATAGASRCSGSRSTWPITSCPACSTARCASPTIRAPSSGASTSRAPSRHPAWWPC